MREFKANEHITLKMETNCVNIYFNDYNLTSLNKDDLEAILTSINIDLLKAIIKAVEEFQHPEYGMEKVYSVTERLANIRFKQFSQFFNGRSLQQVFDEVYPGSHIYGEDIVNSFKQHWKDLWSILLGSLIRVEDDDVLINHRVIFIIESIGTVMEEKFKNYFLKCMYDLHYSFEEELPNLTLNTIKKFLGSEQLLTYLNNVEYWQIVADKYTYRAPFDMIAHSILEGLKSNDRIFYSLAERVFDRFINYIEMDSLDFELVQDFKYEKISREEFLNYYAESYYPY